MKNATKTVVLTSLFTLMITMAQADVFFRSPTSYAPTWSTLFPYQRNIDMGFTVNPVAAASSTGIPGAIYEGKLDSTLEDSDYVLLTGNVSWYGSLSGITQTGLIGIDNRAGGTVLSGTAIFHIDNTNYANRVKHVWAEALTIASGGATEREQVYDPNGQLGTLLNNCPTNDTYNGEILSDFEFQITPNPSYESFVITFTVPAGGYALFDQLQIATECVPEPATLNLLALGGLALLWRRRS